MKVETVSVAKSITLGFTSPPPKKFASPMMNGMVKMHVVFAETPDGWTMRITNPSPDHPLHPCQVLNLEAAVKHFCDLNRPAEENPEDLPVGGLPSNITPDVSDILFRAATAIDKITKTNNGRTALYNSLLWLTNAHLPEAKP